MKEEEYPGLMELSEEGIKVNRWLYVQLGQVDAERWHWQGDGSSVWVGGMQDPQNMNAHWIMTHRDPPRCMEVNEGKAGATSAA